MKNSNNTIIYNDNISVISINNNNNNIHIYDGYIIIIIILLLWLLGCFINGWNEGRLDLIIWGFLAILPFSIFLFYIILQTKQYNKNHKDFISSWKFVGVIGTSFIVFVLIMIIELIIIFIIISIGRYFEIEYKNTSIINNIILSSLFAIFVPSLIEEFGKFIISIVNINDHSPLDIIIISITGALTIATIENCQYIFHTFYSTIPCCTSFSKMAIEVILRDIFSVTIHISTGTLIGIEIAKIKIKEKPIYLSLIQILLLPIILHGIFDTVLLWNSIQLKQNNEIWLTIINILACLTVFISLLITFIKLRNLKKYIDKSTILPSLNYNNI